MKNRTDDDGKILRDGERLRVPMTARDSRLSPLQRAVAASTADRARVTDGTDDWRGMQRPGYRMQVDDRERSLVDEAYRQRDLCDANAWRSMAGAPRGAVEGDECTVREGGQDEGAPGHLHTVNGMLCCIPDPDYRTDSRGKSVDKRQAEYTAYDQALSSAWKNPL